MACVAKMAILKPTVLVCSRPTANWSIVLPISHNYVTLSQQSPEVPNIRLRNSKRYTMYRRVSRAPKRRQCKPYIFLCFVLNIYFNFTYFPVLFSKFANSIPRPFGVRYNAYTQSIEVLDSKKQIRNLMDDINSEFQILQNAVEKLKV